jgi:hypothetical protein
MLTICERSFRISKLSEESREVLEVIVSASGTLADVAKTCGTSFDQTEKHLSLLLNQALVTRSVGNRECAVYRAA